jgi:hypothetical protein
VFTFNSIGGLDQLWRVELDAYAAALLAGAAARLGGLQRLGERAALRPRGPDEGANLLLAQAPGPC